MEKILFKDWKLKYKDKLLPCSVPGDINVDLYKNGVIDDPYFGLNHLDSRWVGFEDFDYINEFEVSKELLENESIEIVFEGIDLFAEIFVNGNSLGKTANMFRRYSFEIKPYLKEGKNNLTVKMTGTLKELKNYDASKYVGVFNKERLLIRKAQCHFGWDWAPDICAYGIWQDVYLNVGSKCKIIDSHYFADDKGNFTLFAEVNYSLRPTYAPGAVIAIEATPYDDDKLVFSISKKPFGNEYISKVVELDAQKSFANFHIDDVELWWPVGYGKQPLYNYKVELYRGGKVVSTSSGRVGFRTVKLEEKQIGDRILSHTFVINGKEIFIKGSNWVPVECFTGVVTDEKYKRLIDIALAGHYNMLRVWGGGLYEKEIFYNYCDEVGMLTWQDLALACGDIPDDIPEWVDSMIIEVEEQVKRLRVHPSLVYWCGGNEKTGAFAREITRGDRFVDYVLPGIVDCFDGKRPFKRQSPCSYTDVPNDLTSGESHYGNFESTLVKGLLALKDMTAERVVNFVGEAAIMGPSALESIKKMIPSDKLWPLNEVWNDRLMDNPYAVVKMDFAHREQFYASTYGEVNSIESFVLKGGIAHQEAVRCELEWSRAHKEATSGFMNWMYSDIWPQSTWAVVDYYCEPKPAFYQQKRSYAPIYASFIQNAEGKTELFVVNDKYENYSSLVKFGVKTYDGTVLFEDSLEVKDLYNSVVRKLVNFDCNTPSIYLFVSYVVDGETITNLYSPKMFIDGKFGSKYSVSTKQVNDKEALVTIKADEFIKSLFISHKDNNLFDYSDNYLDLEPNSERVIKVTSKVPFKVEELEYTDYSKVK